ncbi:hypothetical protein TRVA0_030S00518 [Trichomonascus vanleenenianus]|uniref:uncharacterized protein n=1 Tax=Trichomonascus vanleenenianus TaxID=2268995 RepID=UPI003ECA0EFD
MVVIEGLSKNRQLSLKLLIAGVTMMGFSSFALYKRVILGEEKRKQLGEITPDGELRMFDDKEIAQRERDSWFTKVFGNK